MASPTTQARTTPAGVFLKDGYQTLIASISDPDIEFWEKTVQPLGFDGGDMIDNTTMFNTTWRVFRPRSLFTTTDVSVTAAYDPKVLDSIVAIKGVENGWTIHFPNGDTWDFWGVLRTFTPQEHSEGSQPEAQIVISPTNYDPTNNVESGPNYITAAGTDLV